MFVGAIADGAVLEWPLSTDHTRDLCEMPSRSVRFFLRTIDGHLSVDRSERLKSEIRLYLRLWTVSVAQAAVDRNHLAAKTQVLARFPYSAALLVPKSAASQESALKNPQSLQAASLQYKLSCGILSTASEDSSIWDLGSV